MTRYRFLALAAFPFAVPLAALAQANNPIDPGLPLTTHASAVCSDDTLNGQTNHGNAFAGCSGTRQAENPVTLAHVAESATASADVRTGQLKAVATSQAYSFGDDLLRVGGLSFAELYDTLTIEGPLTGVVSVTMHMVLDGGFSPATPTRRRMGRP